MLGSSNVSLAASPSLLQFRSSGSAGSAGAAVPLGANTIGISLGGGWATACADDATTAHALVHAPPGALLGAAAQRQAPDGTLRLLADGVLSADECALLVARRPRALVPPPEGPRGEALKGEVRGRGEAAHSALHGSGAACDSATQSHERLSSGAAGLP